MKWLIQLKLNNILFYFHLLTVSDRSNSEPPCGRQELTSYISPKEFESQLSD